MSAHKDIRKPFSVTHPKTGETRHFEAVGFLNEGEAFIYGDEMLRRVSDAIGEEDANFLDECVGQDWSKDLWPFYLATNRRHPDYPRDVRSFDRGGGGWSRDWDSLGHRWSGSGLVVRRCA